ncbi:MAG: alpha/beta fold hydrolase [Anaerolineae bacterium]
MSPTRIGIVVLVLLITASMACNFPFAGSGPAAPAGPVQPPDAPSPTAAAVPTPAYEPRFEPAACQFAIPPGTAPECGYLVVPEDRAVLGGPVVRLHVARFRSTAAQPQPDPVIHLSGGPGSPSLEYAVYYFNYGMGGVLSGRDYIIFDQRGTGFSLPGLHCPERVEIVPALLGGIDYDGQLALEVEAAAACRDRLQAQGIDLAAYTSAASAADVNDLRRVFGYEQVNLYGVSYGSRLALTIMRDYPATLRSVILDSPYPPQVNLYTSWPSSAQRAFDALFDACAADPGCSAAYPNLEEEFYALVDRLNADPPVVRVTDPVTNTVHEVILTGGVFMDVIFVGLYPPFFIPQVPRLIDEVRSGQYDGLLPARLQLNFARNSSVGMRNSVQCAEEIPFGSYQDVVDASLGLQPQVREHFVRSMASMFAICEVWGVPPLPPLENEPVSSVVPTLILTGQLDPITPPEWGRLAAQTLPAAYVYEFPGTGHWQMRSGSCPLQIGMAFLQNPYQPPDTGCIAGMGSPAFR